MTPERVTEIITECQGRGAPWTPAVAEKIAAESAKELALARTNAVEEIIADLQGCITRCQRIGEEDKEMNRCQSCDTVQWVIDARLRRMISGGKL